MLQSGRSEQRATRRTNVALELLLARKVGQPIVATTVDVSVGGARVMSERPLRIDEQLRFDCDLPAAHLDGTARVLRQDRHNVYALRFEQVRPDMVAELRAFVDG
jgi:hypothetical protein